MKTYKQLMVELNVLKMIPQTVKRRIVASIMSFASLLSGCALEPMTNQTPEMIIAKITADASQDIYSRNLIASWIRFCKRFERECVPVAGKEVIPYKLADELNYDLNNKIRYDSVEWRELGDGTIKDQEFSHGENGTGICIDIALAKRAALLKKGYGTKSMSLAITSINKMWDHAVLIVKTDKGDFLLDNRNMEPVKLSQTYKMLDAIEADGKWYLINRFGLSIPGNQPHDIALK